MGCCRDQKASLLTRLGQPAGPAMLLPLGPALLLAALALPPRPRAGRGSCTQSVRLVPRHYLPPKIPDIRIFLRSLTVEEIFEDFGSHWRGLAVAVLCPRRAFAAAAARYCRLAPRRRGGVGLRAVYSTNLI